MAGRILPAIFGPAEKNTERTSRTEAIARADPSVAGAGDEDLVRHAAPDSAAVLRGGQMPGAVESGRGHRCGGGGASVPAGLRPDCGVPSTDQIRRSARALRQPAAGVFTRGLRAIAAFRRFRPRTGR